MTTCVSPQACRKSVAQQTVRLKQPSKLWLKVQLKLLQILHKLQQGKLAPKLKLDMNGIGSSICNWDLGLYFTLRESSLMWEPMCTSEQDSLQAGHTHTHTHTPYKCGRQQCNCMPDSTSHQHDGTQSNMSLCTHTQHQRVGMSPRPTDSLSASAESASFCGISECYVVNSVAS